MVTNAALEGEPPPGALAPGSGDAALLPSLDLPPPLPPPPSIKPGVVRSTPSAEGSRIHAVRAIMSAKWGSPTAP
jgi:hypothetical protein